MNWRRDWRILGPNVLTWGAMGGVMGLALVTQWESERDYSFVSHYGWPMEVGIRDDTGSLFAPMGWAPRGLAPSKYEWNGQGVVFNVVFFAGMLVAVAIVVERLIWNWLRLWQFSLAALLWISSVFGATIAIVSQGYLPVVLDCFEYLHLKPRSELYLPAVVRIPIYVGIACLVYVIADSAFRAAVAAFEWWSKASSDAASGLRRSMRPRR